MADKNIVDKIKGKEDTENLSLFTETFSSFNKAIKSLNNSYAELQARYQKLSDELSTTNERLRETLEDNVQTNIFLENVLESLTSGIITINLKGRISSINKAGCKILKCQSNEIIGEEYQTIFNNSLAGNKSLCELLTGSQNYKNVEKDVLINKSNAVPLSVSSALLNDAAGNIIGALECFVDLTDLKQMEEEFARIKSLAALGEVAAVIAHEVRNPLSGIGGFAALLKSELGEDHPQAEYADKIMASVDKLNYCVSSLLSYAGDMQLDLQNEEVNSFLKETVSYFQIDLQTRDSSTKIKLQLPDKKIKCSLEKENFSGALLNLFRNAEQAMPDGGNIEVRLKQNNGKVDIIIDDEGEGVAVDLWDKIFAPFYTTRAGGTGLGLALVKKIIDAHNGGIKLSAKKNNGARFVINLPTG